MPLADLFLRETQELEERLKMRLLKTPQSLRSGTRSSSGSAAAGVGVGDDDVNGHDIPPSLVSSDDTHDDDDESSEQSSEHSTL